MGRRPGPEVNEERCTSKPMNRLGRGTLALQGGKGARALQGVEDLARFILKMKR